MEARSHFIQGRWLAGEGEPLFSCDPATGQRVWEGRAATVAEVDQAVIAAHEALERWSDTPLEERIGYLHAFAERLEVHKAELADIICRQTGKPRWEALTEVATMIGKIPVSIEAYHERCRLTTLELPGATGVTLYKPQGVVAVFGPFNLPGHLPNGHIVPALLAGNTVIFKPSEWTPGVAQFTVELWQAAQLPAGVLNLIQGGRTVGQGLANHPGLDGIFFTGSVAGGVALQRALADHPEKILALEMGGNNPLIVHEAANLDAAAYLTIQSAYLTSGQRCSCARRIIVPRGQAGDRFIDRLESMMSRIRVGRYTDEPEPFMGPVISPQAADRLLNDQGELLRRGGDALVPMQRIGSSTAFLTPGLIDVTAVPEREDKEIFGPLLQIIRAADFNAALDEANRTAFGLAAGLLSDRRELFDIFVRRVRAGVVNWNRPLTGASAQLPFGGVGVSGNHRPSGAFAADYCSYPVASLQVDRLAMPEHPTPGLSAASP